MRHNTTERETSEGDLLSVISKSISDTLEKSEMISSYQPLGGATSFAALDEYWSAQHQASFISSTTCDFRVLVDNILQSEDIADKGKAIAKLADEYQSRISKPPAEKGLLARLFSSVKSLLSPENSNEKDLQPSSILVYKDLTGGYRWFGWVSNKWRDRDANANPLKGGEILTSESHKSYVELLDADPSLAPEFWSWHTPGTARKSPADWWDYADGFLVMSGPLTEEEANALLSVEKSGVKLGMSHGFFPLRTSKSQGWIEEYYSFEVSDLPVRFAANPWTGLQTISQEVKEMGFQPDKRKYLVTLLGEDKVQDLEKSTQDMGKALEALAVDSKETSPQVPEPTPTIDTKELAETICKSIDLPRVVKAAVEPVMEKVSSLEAFQKDVLGRLEKLEKSEDEKIANLLSPASTPAAASGTPASKAADTVVPDTDPLVTQAKDSTISWVKEAFVPSASH